MLNLNSDTDAKSSCPENNEPSAVEAFEVIWEQLVQLPIGTVLNHYCKAKLIEQPNTLEP